MAAILIDPGHGGPDPGACANGLREADITLTAGKLLMALLRQRGHTAYLTRDTDTALAHDKAGDLEERCEMERKLRPALTVSLHCNAAENGAAKGFEVWTSPGQTRSDQAAELIVGAFATQFPGRLIRRDLSDGDADKEAKFRVLTGTHGPAVLVEFGFLTNPVEAQWIKGELPRICQAMAVGIESFVEGVV